MFDIASKLKSNNRDALSIFGDVYKKECLKSFMINVYGYNIHFVFSTMRQPYDTDITDQQWTNIFPFFPKPNPLGRPRTQDFREILNAILYILRAGCAWRLLPHDFPKWQTVYYYFRRWQKEGVWNNIHDYLRAEVRPSANRNVEPSAGIVDSQSVATGDHGIEKGFDGGKLVKGRKRHIIVDVMGLLLAVMVHSAGIQERKGLKFLLFKIRHRFPRLSLIWADGGYDGQPLQLWMKRWFKRVIEVVKRNQETKGFEVLPRRWVVERTFAWFGRYRRLSKDYEYLPSTSETMLYIAMINIMLRRLTRSSSNNLIS